MGLFFSQPVASALYEVSLPDFHTEYFNIPGANNPRAVKNSPDAVYAEYYKRDDQRQYIGRFDKKTKTWTERVMKTSFIDTGFYVVNGAIYLSLEEGGIARYDWDKDEVTLLASSRRKPAQNQFDDRPRYYVSDIFAGPNNQPCVTADGTYYIQDQPGPWREVFDSEPYTQVQAQLDRTLVWSQEGEVVLLDPAQTAPQYLMTPAQPHYLKIPPLGQKGAPAMASWASQTLWDAPGDRALKSNGSCSSSIGIHNDKLFVFVSPMLATGAFELLVYSNEGGRTPRHIPLQFHFDDATRVSLGAVYNAKDGVRDAWTLDKIEHPGSPFFGLKLVTTNQGLCLVCDVGGFWFIPYSQIDDYLKPHDDSIHLLDK